MSIYDEKRKWRRHSVYYFLSNNEGLFSLADLNRELKIGRDDVKGFLDDLIERGLVRRITKDTEYYDKSFYEVKE